MSRFLNCCQRGCRCSRGANIECFQNSDPYPIGELLFALITLFRLKSNLRNTQKFLCAALIDSSNSKELGFGLSSSIEIIEVMIVETLFGHQGVLRLCCWLNHPALLGPAGELFWISPPALLGPARGDLFWVGTPALLGPAGDLFWVGPPVLLGPAGGLRLLGVSSTMQGVVGGRVLHGVSSTIHGVIGGGCCSLPNARSHWGEGADHGQLPNARSHWGDFAFFRLT
jgi:hypothetical protein